jgi:hypothetical protein
MYLFQSRFFKKFSFKKYGSPSQHITAVQIIKKETLIKKTLIEKENLMWPMKHFPIHWNSKMIKRHLTQTKNWTRY